MAKKILLLALALLLAGAAPAAAAEMGSSFYFIKKGMFEIGVQGSYVNDTKMKDTSLNSNGTGGNIIAPKTNVEIKQDTTAAAIITYGIIDRLNVWAELGATVDGRLAGDVKVSGFGTYSVESSLGTVFSWAFGIKGQIYQQHKKKGFGIAASLRYYRYDDRPADSWTVTGGSVSTKGLETDTTFSYWQADATISAYWKFKRWVPYIGAKYMYADGSLTGNWNISGVGRGSVDTDYEPEMQLGFFAGIDFFLSKRWRLNVQGNFYNTTALLVSGSYAF
ncbi:MAG: hypothetical protein K9K66_10145 [Desulfarculaceae bacterium]|nr:hypothetical protein [Desulfarculaceae bacterium]MCF8073768.1 hypothetical protein [Desulfarculaceae bacterium]MCF8102009.1 hypothetical protein [Desulfarculaceae bacterium]MCF8115979.1 hypothetical protein [Desulfarculaceae bacterium]